MRPQLIFFSAVALSAGIALLLHDRPPAPNDPRPPGRPAVPHLQIPHSSPFDTFSPEVRVNLTPSPQRTIELQIDGPYELRAAGSPLTLSRGDALKLAAVKASAHGLQIGNQRHSASRVEIIPRNSPSIWINGHQYRGTVRLYRRSDQTILAVNHVPLERYIASVIDSEMPAAFPDAARQAQAIVARTYVLYQMARSHPLFDVFASTQSQKYLGFQYRDSKGRRLAGESDSSREIARETTRIVLTYQGQLFCTYYSAACGGRTTAGDQVFTDAAAPLRSVACDWCGDARYYRWTTRASIAEMSADLRRRFTQLGALQSLKRIQGPALDHRAVYRVSDGRRHYDLSATELRRCLSASLHSPRFEVRHEREGYVFEGQGHGHGVGFCQWGARGQALAARSAEQILRHYYPGAELVAVESEPARR